MADGGVLERLLAAQRCLAGDVLLEIGIQPFIWIEVRAVGRQVGDLDLLGDLDLFLVLGQPLTHRC